MKVAPHVYEATCNNYNGGKRIKKYQGKFKYQGTNYHCGWHETIKQAQISVDLKRISLGLKPALLKPIIK